MQKLKVLFVTLLAVLTLAHSTPSEAVVGKLTHRQKVVTVGLAMTGSGVAIAAGGFALVSATCVDMGCLAVLFPLAIGGVIGIAGLITLEGEQELQFTALDRVAAQRIGVSDAERVAFNEEIDQANILISDVSHQLSTIENLTVEDSASLWDSMRSFVSPETFSAMQKIVSQR